jgi:hypothetical protein
MPSTASVATTLIVIPYCPIKELSNYREQFYNFVDDFQQKLSRELEEDSQLVQIVVIDTVGRVIDTHLDKNSESSIQDDSIRAMNMSYGALCNTAYYIAKFSKMPFERILFHEPFFMPNRNLMRLYFQYSSSSSSIGSTKGLIHFTSVYRELFPKSSPYMGVFSVDTATFYECNGFPTHITDRVQLFERFMNRVRRICSPIHVYTNDVERTSMFYHLYYEDLLGDLRVVPQKNVRDPYVQWTDSVYSVLDDEFSGISQTPFFETHQVQELRLRREQSEYHHQTVKAMRYVVKPTPLLSLYNDFPQQFSQSGRLEQMKEYYDFMTEMMNYIVLRFKQTYRIRATVHHAVRHSNHKNDEVIRVYLNDEDIDDTMSMLYGFRAIIQVIEETKRWIEEFYKCVVSRCELNQYEFVASIMENISLYMIPIAHPKFPNEVQISIANYTYLYKETAGREKKLELRRQMYQKWTTALFEQQETINEQDIPTMNSMPIVFVPSLQIHTSDYIESIEDAEGDMEVVYAQPVEINEVRDEVRDIRVGKISSVGSSDVTSVGSSGTLNLDNTPSNEIKSAVVSEPRQEVKHIRISSYANPLRDTISEEDLADDGDDDYEM